MHLSEARLSKTYIVEKITLSGEEKRRILDLGLTNGTKIKIINLKKDGPMIISVRGTYIAIGRKYTLGIMVLEMES